MNSDAVASTDKEHSVGLFQLNMEGGLGSGHDEADLKDPDKNIAIIIGAAKKSHKFENANLLEEAVAAFVNDIERPGGDRAKVIAERLKVAEGFAAPQNLQPVSIAATGGARYIAQNPERWQGRSVGTGECVAFVQEAASAPHTSDWNRARLVKGDLSVPQGAAIATFEPNGRYGNQPGRSHAAIYVGQNDQGLNVWDQWKGQPVHKRLLRFGGKTPVNNGDEFYVIG